MNVIRSGRSILLSDPPLYNPHLWFILTDPASKDGKVVVVMLRTATRFTDTTLILEAGDHPFIRHPSSVHYSTANFLTCAQILKALKSGRCHLREDMSPGLLEKVRAGLLKSPFTVHFIRDHCRRQFSVP